MLKTERDTAAMHVRARNAFRAWAQGSRGGRRHTHFKRRGFGPVSPTSAFEHGQLWITCSCGANYSVVDATGVDSVDGFSFEQVTPGDEV